MPHYRRVRYALKKKGIDPTNVKDLSQFLDQTSKRKINEPSGYQNLSVRIHQNTLTQLEAAAVRDGVSKYHIAQQILEAWATGKFEKPARK